MKHFIFTFLGLVLYHTSTNAQDIRIFTGGSSGTPHPIAISSITNERDFVTIDSDSLIYNVHIIIKDNIGNIMYDDTITIAPSSNTIFVPEEYDNEKYTIEIFYDEKYFMGRLEEE
ncbi:DUF3244 domain-containing protein [Prevotella sp. PCHR]|uniref:DUF3244 domain-containing protein n=2 Tax=Xylanibacter caecicola TaxID=2736294 RepID=A0ABX2AZG4_9BACT|nr:DUF3244 domain-containing protein [Xylanibacter caecicola]NPE24646.1 DUF3244 domain-containing protein [Xylanibacter caecicola]